MKLAIVACALAVFSAIGSSNAQVGMKGNLQLQLHSQAPSGFFGSTGDDLGQTAPGEDYIVLEQRVLPLWFSEDETWVRIIPRSDYTPEAALDPSAGAWAQVPADQMSNLEWLQP